MSGHPGASALADALGLFVIILAAPRLLPSAPLLYLPTVTAGGDTPCNFLTAVRFHDRLPPSCGGTAGILAPASATRCSTTPSPRRSP